MNMINNHSAHPLDRYISQFLPSLGKEDTPPPTRTRITRACDHCQLKKTKCDDMKPRCSQCIKRNDPCTFTKRVCKRGPKPKIYNYLYSGTGEVQVIKSINVCPYPNYLSNSNSHQHRELGNSTNNINKMNGKGFRKSSHSMLHQAPPRQHSKVQNIIEYNLHSSADCPPSLQNFEFQKLPPIQFSKPSTPQQQNFDQHRGESLILPSLSRNYYNRLPSISMLLKEESDAMLKSYDRPTATNNQSTLKITLQDYYKPINNQRYYNHKNQSRNSYLKELY